MSLSRPAEAWIVCLQLLTAFSMAGRDFPGKSRQSLSTRCSISQSCHELLSPSGAAESSRIAVGNSQPSSLSLQLTPTRKDPHLSHQSKRIHDKSGILDFPIDDAVDCYPPNGHSATVAGTPKNSARRVPVQTNRLTTLSPSSICSSTNQCMFGNAAWKRCKTSFRPLSPGP